MTESIPVFTLLGASVYPYGLILALALALATGLEALCLRRVYPRQTPSALGLMLAALPCGFVCARLVYCLANLNMVLVDLPPAFALKTWMGGFSLAGAILGAVLGLWLYARGTGRSAARLLDASIPAGALVLALGRLAEATTAQGLGDYVMSESLQFFPLSVANAYGEYQIPVFFYEACVALGILAFALVRLGKGREGSLALRALLLLCMTQVLLESLREDDFIRFGFVRFNQLCAAVALLLPLCLWTGCRGRRFWLRLAGVLGCVALCIWVEFALDKTNLSVWLLYGLMAGAMGGCYALVGSGEKGKA